MRVARSRTLRAPVADVWRVLDDPYSLPRWWPLVRRVEAVSAAGWTMVLGKPGGRGVRADQRLEATEPERLRRWALEVAGSPFERLLSASVTEARLAPDPAGAELTLELRQSPRGMARFGALHAAPGGPPAARRGAGRHGAGGGAVSREQQLLRLGRAGRRAGAARPRRGRCCGSGSACSGAVVSRPVALDDVRLRPPVAGAALRAALEGAVGAANVHDDRATRVLRAAGKSYLDLLALRAGDAEAAPDLVVAPGSHADVQAVLRACAEGGAAVIPFGGGTSVVGGVAPERGRFETAVSLDLRRLDAMLDVDERSRTARVQAGRRLPELDHALAAHGLRLGHVPQSYEWATVGGCAATRSAGQASTGFGRFDELVTVGAVRHAGRRRSPRWARPASAAGPDLQQLVRRLRGDARRDLRGRAAGAAGRGRAALRGVARAGRSPTAARRCARSRRPGSLPTSPGSPTRTRRA